MGKSFQALPCGVSCADGIRGVAVHYPLRFWHALEPPTEDEKRFEIRLSLTEPLAQLIGCCQLRAVVERDQLVITLVEMQRDHRLSFRKE